MPNESPIDDKSAADRLAAADKATDAAVENLFFLGAYNPEHRDKANRAVAMIVEARALMGMGKLQERD